MDAAWVVVRPLGQHDLVFFAAVAHFSQVLVLIVAGAGPSWVPIRQNHVTEITLGQLLSGYLMGEGKRPGRRTVVAEECNE